MSMSSDLRVRATLTGALLALAAFALTVAGSGVPGPRLVLACDGSVYVYRIPHEGLIVEYQWLHSVEGTTVIEYYNATRSGLTLVKAMARSLGAGHPYSAETLRGGFHVEDGYLVYTGAYNVGYELEIQGPREYSKYIRVGGVRVCGGFHHATLKVEG